MLNLSEIGLFYFTNLAELDSRRWLKIQERGPVSSYMLSTAQMYDKSAHSQSIVRILVAWYNYRILSLLTNFRKYGPDSKWQTWWCFIIKEGLVNFYNIIHFHYTLMLNFMRNIPDLRCLNSKWPTKNGTGRAYFRVVWSFKKIQWVFWPIKHVAQYWIKPIGS